MSSLHRLLLFLAVATRLCAAEPVVLLKVTAPDKALAFTAGEFTALPRTEITVLDPHDQKEHHYAGVAVRELMARAGAPLGDKLRGAALQLTVIARARDGYAVVFALAEFDEAFSDRTILLVDIEDGKPLSEASAPLRLVVPGDKKAARWEKMVTSLEIAPAPAAAPTTKP